MAFPSKTRRSWLEQSIILLLIIGVALVIPAAKFEFSARYAYAQVGITEPSPPSEAGQGGQPAGPAAAGQPTAPQGPPAAGGFISQTVDVISETPTALGFVANVAQGIAPTAAQTGAVIGSLIGNVIGSVIGGPIGSTVLGFFGGIIGSIIGSLFSGSKSGGEDITNPDVTPDVTSDVAPDVDVTPNVESDAPQDPSDVTPQQTEAGLAPNAPCFKAGTLVATSVNPDGGFNYRAIEDLAAGDEVLGIAFSDSGEPLFQQSQVLKTSYHEPKRYSFSELVTSGKARITGTSNHPIVINARNEYLRLDQLSPGVPVVSVFSAPQWDSVAGVQALADEFAAVYNIKTGTGNYLVSQDGAGWVLVHNGNGSGSK